MSYASITGWGKCMPPSVLSNADLSTFLDTNDDWILSRTGMKERRVSHVPGSEMATVASERALACAGLPAGELELIVYGSCSNDEQVPNTASAIQARLGAGNAAAMDVNTACTSFLYGLSTATAMIRTGVVRNALVIGVEWITPFIDWSNRGIAVLFGDGCAALVLQASENREGLLAEKLGCYADVRQVLRVRGVGLAYANSGVVLGDTRWDFDGSEIFRHAVVGMAEASAAAMQRSGLSADDIDLVVPHQANLRIIESVAKRCGLPMAKVMLTVQRYGNMSSATVPVALVEALEEGRVKPGAHILMPAFGAGLTLCSHVIRWGQRTTPVAVSSAELPPCPRSALEIVNELRARKAGQAARSDAGLAAPRFAEQLKQSAGISPGA